MTKSAWLTALWGLSLTACTNDNKVSDDHVTLASFKPVAQVQKQKEAVLPVRRGAIDNCPRLIQKRVDSTQVLRRDKIREKTCDYFIYPQQGEQISVQVSNDKIHASLHKPYVHDFNNGSYRVISNGRHVIRLQYDAFGTQPQVMDFVIEVDILPIKDEL